jgi:hypothetical protein
LRHVPIDPNTFEYYGDNLLPNFDTLPTWVYATPHTTQRRALQAATCNDCHGNVGMFLTKDDLLPYEIEANKNVVVDEKNIPAPVASPLPTHLKHTPLNISSPIAHSVPSI